MKQLLLKTLVTALLLSGAMGVLYAGTYASNLRASNPDSTKAFDGTFSDGTGAKLWFTLNGAADTVKVWVVSGGPGGNRIRSFAPLVNRTAGIHNILWDGTDDSGKVVMNGRFSFEVFTSDTGNSTAQWAQAWENPVYLLAGGGLSSRDIEVVQDPMNPSFGNLILTESSTTYGYARMLTAQANGTLITEYSRSLFPQGSSDFDPWFISLGRNGAQYVTNSTLSKIFVFRDSVLVNTIQDAKIGSPKGIATMGSGEPTLLIATGRAVVRRSPAGVIDTIFADTNAAGYVRDVAVDDSGYVFISFGASATTYMKVIKLSRTFVRLDTLTLPERVTHLNIFRGANSSSNADDKIYGRVLGANGGVFALDFTAKTSTKLFTPSTSTSASHSIGIDILGNIYYANPSAEWVRMYVPPTSAPTKWLTKGGDVNVVSPLGTKVFDSFNTTAGHFGSQPTFSGSTVGISTSSTSPWSPLASVSQQGGSIAVTLLDNSTVTTPWAVRLLSGGGTPANNDSLAATGWVGFWVKTNNAPPNSSVAIGIDDPLDPTTKRSIQVPVINDGEWHLYQWNIADSLQWTPWVVTSGSAKIKGPRASIDAIWFFAPDTIQAPSWSLFLDDVSYNANGPLGNDAGRGDVTEDGTISNLDASWILQHVVRTRQFSPRQVQSADVNLSHNGTMANSFDAAVVLARVVGKIPALPWTQSLPNVLENTNHDGDLPLSIMIASAKGNAGQVVTIPISVPANLGGVLSGEMTLTYNSSILKIRNIVTTDLTKDFVLVSNIENGAVSIAFANGTALEFGGHILTVEAEILQTSTDIALGLKDVMINDKLVASVTSVGGAPSDVPATYSLMQNYPNPFNPSTTIDYQIPQTGFVELKVYDVAGREIMTLISDVQNAGTHRVVWNGVNSRGEKVSSGVYFYRITAGNFSQIKKMLMLK